MEKFQTPAMEDTPLVSFDHLSGVFKIEGKSFPESAWDFYNPLFQWIDQYTKVPLEKTELAFRMDYVDSSSLKCFVEIGSKLKEMVQENRTFTMIWLFAEEDVEMKEIGESLADVLGSWVEVKAIKEETAED